MGNAIPGKTDIMNDIINNISSKTQSTCSTNSSNLQTISISGLTVNNCTLRVTGISQVTNSSVNANCYQSNEFKALLKDEFDSKLSVIDNIGSSELTTLKNSLVNNVAVDNISSCMANQTNSQGMKFDNITVNCPPGSDREVLFEDISQTITSQLLSDCIQKNIVDYSNYATNGPNATEPVPVPVPVPVQNNNDIYIYTGLAFFILITLIAMIVVAYVMKGVPKGLIIFILFLLIAACVSGIVLTAIY